MTPNDNSRGEKTRIITVEVKETRIVIEVKQTRNNSNIRGERDS